MLTNMLARFAIGTNMLGKKNFEKFRTPFRMILFEFRTSLIKKTKRNISNQKADSKDGSNTAKSQKFHWEDEDIERLIDPL